MTKPLVSRLYPVGHLLNPQTPYVRSEHTDIGARFARVRAQLKARGRVIVVKGGPWKTGAE